MDPNACLRRLLAALEDDDQEELDAAFADLNAWLYLGGFAPKCASLGANKDGTPRRFITNTEERYVLCSVIPGDIKSGFVFKSYTHDGKLRFSVPLRSGE